jgi:hypothetical protein
MKEILFALVCCIPLVAPILAQVSPSSLPKFEPEQLHEDFRVFRSALEEGHSGIYRYTSKAEMDRHFDQAEQSLKVKMDVLEFYRILAPVAARIKCGHTGVGLPSSIGQEFNTTTPLLPLYVKVIDKKPYVLRDFTPAGGLAGKEIISVNGVPAAKIVTTLLDAAGADGDVQTSRQYRISGWSFNGRLVSLMGLGSPYDMVVKDPGSRRQQKATLTGIELPKLQDASRSRYPQDQPSRVAGAFKLLNDGGVGVLTVYQFGGYVDAEKKKGLPDLYKDAFYQMQAKGTRALIIDLRNNGGGADELGKLLLSYLVDQPFKYYDDLIINKMTYDFAKYTDHPPTIPAKMVERRDDGKYHAIGHPNWGIQQPSKPFFSGPVYILINGGSFSTTSEFLSQVHFHKLATFIGEESAGAYYGNTSGPQAAVNLPNTKLILRLPLMTYYMAVSGNKAASHGIIPDHHVEYSVAELIAGTDKEMDLALKLIQKH